MAIATGFPGPDVLDVDQRGPAGDGFTALIKLRDAKLLDGAAAWVRTPSGGMHAYFTGTHQHCGHLPDCHLDFLAAGGYVLAPPSVVGGKPYRGLREPGGRGALNWTRSPGSCNPSGSPGRTGHPVLIWGTWHAGSRPSLRATGTRAVWGREPRPGDRPRRRPEPAGRRRPPGRLADPEITRTLDSARRTAHPDPGYGPEGR